MAQNHYSEDVAKKAIIESLADHYKADVVTTTQVKEFCQSRGLPFPHFLNTEAEYKASFGKIRLRKKASEGVPAPVDAAALTPQAAPVETPPASPRQAVRLITEDSFVPALDPTYVPWGFYEDVKEIFASGIFYPIYITGLSGNGKTLMPLQACAQLKREIVRCNITKRTDELDLFGGYELINGDTVRREGPVITAMRRGAILLLDETDLGTEDLLCLQPVLEGRPYLDKKTNTVVHPQPGFNIVATANTKGRGSNDGKFVGANIMNEAMLERFAITVEQNYPNEMLEQQMLDLNFKELGLEDRQFSGCLVKWAAQIRKTYAEDGINEIISTRRLVHIAKAYKIFKQQRMKAIRMCLNRFDDDTKLAMIKAYEAIDPRAKGEPIAQGTSGDTSKAEKATSAGATDIEYVMFSGVMVKKFGTHVSIKNETVNGIKSVAVTSHGRKTVQALNRMPAISSNKEFEQAIQKMVEANITSSKTT